MENSYDIAEIRKALEGALADVDANQDALAQNSFGFFIVQKNGTVEYVFSRVEPDYQQMRLELKSAKYRILKQFPIRKDDTVDSLLLRNFTTHEGK